MSDSDSRDPPDVPVIISGVQEKQMHWLNPHSILSTQNTTLTYMPAVAHATGYSVSSIGKPAGRSAENAINLRTCTRVLIAALFAGSGLMEMLGATGLIMELSPDGRWSAGMHTLAISGPLQVIGAAVLASGHKTRWAMSILGCYAFLVCVFGNLPQIFNPNLGQDALFGLLNNLAVMGGILYWFLSGRQPGDHQAKLAHRLANPAWPRAISLVLGLIAMGGILYWLNAGRPHDTHLATPSVPIVDRLPVYPVRLLV